jgi:hypothetical protein
MPRAVKTIRDNSLLTAALEGLELQKRRIEDQIQEVRLLLGKGTGRRGRPPGSSNNHKRGPGRMSAAARKRIAAAQKRRWAEYRKSAGKAE